MNGESDRDPEQEQTPPGAPADAAPEGNVDRDEILRRRAVFIASAVAGLSLVACKDTAPQPCLSIEYVDPNQTGTTTATTSGGEGSTTGDGATTGSTAGGANDPITPRTADVDAGLAPRSDKPDAGPPPPQPCLAPPQPCLKVAPPQPCLVPPAPKK